MEDVWKGYFAGFFDGEGSIVRTKPTSNSFCLKIDSTDPDVLVRFETAYGGNIVKCGRRADNPKQQWRWTVGSKDKVSKALTDWLPYLSSRRAAKAIEALNVLKNNRGRKTSSKFNLSAEDIK